MSIESENELAVSLGYTPVMDAARGGGWCSFDQGKRRVWLCSVGWQTADIVHGSFRNHAPYPTLSEALRREL